MRVEASGTQVAPRVGLRLLGRFADRVELGDTLSAAVPCRGERAPVHDRGEVLVHAGLMLAGGGEACTDVEALAAGGDRAIFTGVCSDSTLWRVLDDELTPGVVDAVWAAMVKVRAEVWARSAATTGSEPVVLDIDASLVEVHSENTEGSAAHYKGGFGFHPMFCFADATGEALAAMLRRGNAGANSIADHVAVLDAAVSQLPAEIAAGHRAGDDPGLVGRVVRVRTDSAGCTDFVSHCRDRNIGFSVVARTTTAIHGAIHKIHTDADDAWQPALGTDGRLRDDAFVTELTDAVDLSGWPPGTRLIVRREPRHQGAQQSLFPSEQWRYWGHYTDQKGDPAVLDADMRAHAHVEQHIARLKDSGAARVPLHRLRRRRRRARPRVLGRGPRPLVPAPLPHRTSHPRQPQSHAPEALPRPRTRRPPRRPSRPPAPRRLARHPHPPRHRHATTPTRLTGHADPTRRRSNPVHRTPKPDQGPE